MHNEKKILSFWKLITENFRGTKLKLMKLKICDRTYLTSLFLYLLWKYSRVDLKISLFLFVCLKTMICKYWIPDLQHFEWFSSKICIFLKRLSAFKEILLCLYVYKGAFCSSKTWISQKLQIIIMWILRHIVYN